ncbi:MAG TPA: AtpZ/AtpI family protein [Gemmataceae bacterium]|nr:AtpZ/AtpI family protein [Gemmataceae bacterium]
MPEPPPTSKELGHYITIAQIGMEMAAPAGIGLILDHYLGWRPWGVVVGAVFGLLGGLAHLIALTNQQQDSGSPKPRRDVP